MSDPKNGYLIEHKIGHHEYAIQLATPEYMACQEQSDKPFNESIFRARVAELKNVVYFLIRMKTLSAASDEVMRPRTLSEADAAVAYYAQEAMQDIKLKAGEKTFSPVAYEYENNYGLSPYNTILVAFNTGSSSEDLLLTFDDRYRQAPAINSSFKQSLLSSAPGVQLK
ncbi:hypothetical protein GCM10023092_16190 [Rurimicrobium arvi]|uniref:DUF1795 domain-containing protein n=2 Tax=Rurimicrobium arvi TaxID=2049916 RepID=A0ABP8MQP4_9BACT